MPPLSMTMLPSIHTCEPFAELQEKEYKPGALIIKMPVKSIAADSSGQSLASKRKSRFLWKFSLSVIKVCIGVTVAISGICVSSSSK